MVKYATHMSYLADVWGQVMSEVTSLRVSRRTRDQLAQLGSKDESFDTIIQRLLDFYRNNSGARIQVTHRRRTESNADQ